VNDTHDGNRPPGILIVDDEKSNLALLNKILAPKYTVRVARSGEEALEQIAECVPDLILLDIVMPGMSGFEVIARLKDDPTTKRIPVIFVTGTNEEDAEEKGLNLGAVDYIEKPVREAIVLARVRNHMQIVHQMRVIERLGLFDPLTDIANRRSFDDHLLREWKSAIRDQSPLSLLMLDIDNFKAYNDTYGHPQGDVLLKAIARLIKSAATRRPRDIGARIGGEEFVVLCPQTDHAGALDIAERLRHAAENTKVLSFNRELTSTTVSIGVATVIPRDAVNMIDFVKLADERLYTAKSAGRNRIIG